VAERSKNSNGSSGELGEEFQHLLTAVAGRVFSSASDKIGGLTEKLSDAAQNSDNPTAKALGKAGGKAAEGKSPLSAGLSAATEGIKSKVGNLFGGGGGGGKGGKGKGKGTKVTNIIEQIDIGAPVDVVYDQWTQFQDFSGFMKKVESVDQKDDEKLTFKAQVLWSHRTWDATIIEQVPDQRIVWKSSGEKGHVDGAVTFHEIGPELTRVLVVLEYHPQGLFEHTGNLWRAQGRRVRLELKHFRRHVMTHSLLHPDELEGWRGEIHDSEVTRSDEDARAEEEDENEDGEDYDEDDEDEEAEDEYDDDDGDEDYDDEEDEDEDDEEPRSRRRSKSKSGRK
jgi:Predicted integral membrane protein